jgi:uncharacterized protein YdhG (YjbR/CyaY superfamily)
MSDTKAVKRTKAKSTAYEGFTEDERAAMKDRAQELKSASRRGSQPSEEEVENEVLAKIAEMPEADRVVAERLHQLIRSSAPHLTPRLYYGMPAYAKNGKVLCFFQPASKFKARYGTLGFQDGAQLDDGAMWPTSFALTKLSPDVEKRISALVKQAAA